MNNAAQKKPATRGTKSGQHHYTAEERRVARNHFVYEKLPVTRVAEILGIPAKTIYRWKETDTQNGMNWDTMRAASRLNDSGQGEAMMEEAYALYHSLREQLSLDVAASVIDKIESFAKLADGLSKIAKIAGVYSPNINKQAMALFAIKEFMAYLRGEAPDLFPALSAHIEPFSAHLAKIIDREKR
jgi:hypothetical protein